MAEYIEREALIKKLRIMPIPKQAGSANTWLDNCAAGVNAAIREVASFPAADVVQVLRCKDCKDWGPRTGGVPICWETYEPMPPDGFCSIGERKPSADG